MKKLFFFAAIAAMAGVITSCSNDDEVASNQVANLGINVSMNEASSRAATQVSSVTSGMKLGVTLHKETSADAYASGSSNVEYSYNGSKWSGGIYLNNAKGRVSAYYPYGNTINPTAISMSSSTPTDWMYQTISTDKYDVSSPSANITLKHAQALIKVKIQKSSTNPYTGTGAVSKIVISSSTSSFATTGTLNSTTGAVTGTYAALTQDSWGKSIASAAVEDQWFVSPIAETATASKLSFAVTVDGKVYNVTDAVVKTASSTDTAIKQGNIYTFTLNLSDTGLSLGTVSITAWATGGSASGNLQP